MVKEDRTAVPKHPCNGWIYFFQKQSKMTKKSSSNRMSMSEIREKWKALGDKAKQKYTEKAKLSSEEYKEQKVKVDPQEDSKETFTTRTQLKTTCDIIRNLQPQQVESVKAMGFGGLLRLKCTRLDRKLCEQLLRFTSDEGRNKLILDLILCGENEIRNDVIRKAQEKYRNTRRM